MTDRQELPEDERIARLLRLAGLRPEAPPGVAHRVKGAALAQWRAVVKARRRRRAIAWTLGGMAASAAAILLLAFGLRPAGPSPGDPPAGAPRRAGVLLRSIGPVTGSDGSPLAPGRELRAAAVVETSTGSRAALELDGGAVVRMDHGTKIVIEDEGTIALLGGTLYVASGGEAEQSGRVTVRTPSGAVRDIGTQFEVHVGEGRIRVRVRRGEVVLEDRNRRRDVRSGQEILIDEDGEVGLTDVHPHGAAWDWILEIAPSFRLEGRTLEEYLDWYQSETGMQVDLSGEAKARGAGHIVLHGSIEGIRPDRTPEVVLPACGLRHEASSGTIHIRPAAGGTHGKDGTHP